MGAWGSLPCHSRLALRRSRPHHQWGASTGLAPAHLVWDGVARRDGVVPGLDAQQRHAHARHAARRAGAGVVGLHRGPAERVDGERVVKVPDGAGCHDLVQLEGLLRMRGSRARAGGLVGPEGCEVVGLRRKWPEEWLPAGSEPGRREACGATGVKLASGASCRFRCRAASAHRSSSSPDDARPCPSSPAHLDAHPDLFVPLVDALEAVGQPPVVHLQAPPGSQPHIRYGKPWHRRASSTRLAACRHQRIREGASCHDAEGRVRRHAERVSSGGGGAC